MNSDRQTFEGIFLSDRIQGGRTSGILKVDASQIKFYSGQECLETISLRQLEISRGGTGNRYIYLKDSGRRDFTFYTDDLKILDVPELKWHKETAGISGKIKQSVYRNYLLIALVILMVLGSVTLLILKSDKIIDKIASLIPTTLDTRISETMKSSAIEGKTILKDSILNAQIQIITSKLLNQTDTAGFNFSFTVIKADEVNAFALPGGPIIIHSGLLLKAESAEEIAGVLAHEISHVTRRHHLRGILGNMSIYFIFRGLIGDVTGISAEIINAGAALGSLKYSRNYEKEADETGMALLKRAKINTNGLISFFDKLSEEHPLPESADFLSTHPNPKNRIENLKKIQETNSNPIDLGVDLKLLKERVSLEK